MVEYQSIHETVIDDIFNTIKDGINVVDKVFVHKAPSKSNNIAQAGSLARATSALTLVFPVLVSNSLPIETASMIAKAIERRNVSMLQMAFSAYSLTYGKSAVEHLQDFHTNMDFDKMSLDKFIDVMDGLCEGADTFISSSQVQAVIEDCRKNINFTLEDSVNESSMMSFKEVNRLGNNTIIKEQEVIEEASDDIDDAVKSHSEERQTLAAQLLPMDIKKSNEMQPTLMLVNFYVGDEKDDKMKVAQQMVVGVKSKLYAVDSSEVVNRIIAKNVDSDIILKLVKVSTREISFVKDFLLGLDDAKLNASQKSNKNASQAIFNALERRASKGKVRKTLNNNNMFKAISTLVISSDEVELLKKYNNIDVLQKNVIAPIMEKLGLLYFVVADTVSEAVHVYVDGSSGYETISFTNLERDNSDSSYKKIVNLMTKVAR